MKAGSVRAPVLRVGLPRAVGETLCAQVAVALGLLLLEPHLPTRVLGIRGHAGLFPLASLCGVMWGALRLRLAAGPWPRQLGREGVGGIGQGFAIGLPVVGCSWVATAASGTAPGALAARLISPQGDMLPSPHYHLPAPYLATLVGVSVGLSLLVRLGLRLWLRWERLRRTRLRWALTHAHLLLVALGAAVLSVVVLVANLRTPDVFADLVILVTGTALALLAVLPPSALFAHLVTRGTTRRVEALAAATGAFRRGDYGIRVPVDGADEVARLQADFNAMAADLDRAMRDLDGANRDLQAERDTVTALLDARRELIAGVSHELRTPVATLRSYLESARTHWNGAPPPTLRQDLQVMEHEAIRLPAT